MLILNTTFNTYLLDLIQLFSLVLNDILMPYITFSYLESSLKISVPLYHILLLFIIVLIFIEILSFLITENEHLTSGKK